MIDQSRSLLLELIKNVHHRQSVAKLRSGNHELRIEIGRHCVPKIPENLRICPFVHLMRQKIQSTFFFTVIYRTLKENEINVMVYFKPGE